MTMHKDYLRFLSAAAAVGFNYAKKDEDSGPSIADVNATIEKLSKGWEDFKKKNDERLEQLEKNGDVDVVTKDELEKLSSEVLEAREELKELTKKMERPGGDVGESGEQISQEAKDHHEAYVAFMRQPNSERLKRELQDTEEKAIKAMSEAEQLGLKATSTLTDTAGGYAVPEVISRQIERELSEVSDLRKIVDVTEAGSKDYKELVDVRGAAYGWVGEGDARAETGTPNLEEVSPTFGMIYAYPKATEESLQDIFFNVEKWLKDSVIEAFAEGEENAIILGNGVKKPTGFMNGATNTQKDGTRPFGTLQYLPGGDAALLNDPDKLIDMVQTLKKPYRRNARWLCNKLTVGELMKLKDGDGNYLWKMGDIKSGQPDRLLAYPITESEEMPDVAADTFPLAFGDFKAGYILVPLVGLRTTKDEVTEPGYVKWYIRRRLGGCLKKSEAIKLLKIATS